jgi:two-component system chemotaxis response regulator CheB
MQKIRVLVVEDSLTVRKRLIQALATDPGIEVVGEAEDGKQAVELCRRHRPDIITMDMMMPVMSGLAATEHIMAHQPTPILIVSASINRGELFKIYDALEKPTGEELDDRWEQRLCSAVKIVAKIRVITHPRARLAPQRRVGAPLPARRGEAGPASAPSFEVVAIGASTGGPGAIVEVLRRLPARFQVPILIVLHMNEPFGSAFADWLGAQIERKVAQPRHGDSVASARGQVIVARSGHHLAVRNGRMHLTLDDERHSCRPSVDVLFESVAVDYRGSAVGCLLTGMGRDGAQGLLNIREAGGVTIAQDERSSVVYGMPREAALLGAATHVLSLGDIGPQLAALQGVETGAMP